MRRFIKGKYGLLLIGMILLIWGATSAFSDYKALTYKPDALDNPDSSGDQIVMPNTPSLTSPHSFATSQTVQGTPNAAIPTQNSNDEGPIALLPAQAGSAMAPSISSTSPASGPRPSPTNEPTQIPVGMAPTRIVIPAISLDAPVIKEPYRLVRDDTTGEVYAQYLVPDEYAAGWEAGSALLGVPGNTVLDGHHNVFGEVFGKLIDLNPGAIIEVYSGPTMFKFILTNKMILLDRNQPLSVRLANARWMMPSNDVRLTLVTCWPHWSNTHRLIIVGKFLGAFDEAGSRVNP